MKNKSLKDMNWIERIIILNFYNWKLIETDLIRDENGRVDYSRHGEAGEIKTYECKKHNLTKTKSYYPYSDRLYFRVFRTSN